MSYKKSLLIFSSRLQVVDCDSRAGQNKDCLTAHPGAGYLHGETAGRRRCWQRSGSMRNKTA
jgi:hypothetical protein